MNDLTPTDWLAKLDSHPQAVEEIAKYLLTRARALAAHWIGGYVKAGVGPSDVAAGAVASLIKDMQAREVRPTNSTTLLGLLAHRIHRRAISELRRRHTDMRDVAREEPMPPRMPDASRSPAEVDVVDETAERIMELIHAEPDELRRLVTYSGLVEGISAAKILAAIETHERSNEWQIPSISSIHVWLRAARARIEATLRREGFLDDA